MVEYYNLTKYSGSDGAINFFKITAELTNYYFSYMVLSLVFTIPIMFLYNEGFDVNRSIHYSSLFSFWLALWFYIAEWIINTKVIFFFAIIYIVTAALRWYHQDG